MRVTELGASLKDTFRRLDVTEAAPLAFNSSRAYARGAPAKRNGHEAQVRGARVVGGEKGDAMD